MEELTKKVDELTKMIVVSRDMPPNETWSKLLYDMQGKMNDMQGDMKVHTQILTDIKDQTIKTNGRMNKAEETIIEINKWREGMNGKITAYCSIFAFITPLIYWLITK
jgi:hypothetical protein